MAQRRKTGDDGEGYELVAGEVVTPYEGGMSAAQELVDSNYLRSRRKSAAEMAEVRESLRQSFDESNSTPTIVRQVDNPDEFL